MSTVKKTNTRGRGGFRRAQGGHNVSVKKPSVAEETDKNDDTCLICAENIQYAALTSCNHRTCHKCGFRQRALFKKKSCLVCRTEVEVMKFTNDVGKSYDDLKVSYETNEKYGVFFSNETVATTVMDLLKVCCGICAKNNGELEDFKNTKKLNDHLNNVHNKMICKICAANRYAFTSELPIYTQKQLKTHQSMGDNKGFNGHPMCAFCNGKRFYSDDELYLHMREHHEKCHICDKLNQGAPQYFRDYDQLFQHFKTSHFVCNIQSCLDNKFVVFGDEFELQAHILQEHGEIVRGKPKLFQSELSTFIPTPSRVIRNNESRSTNNSGSLLNNNNNGSSSSLNSITRLEERAKHYLNNSTESLELFNTLNDQYDNNQISANDLLVSYKSLFTSPEANVYLLINNLSEKYSAKSAKHKELKMIYEAEEQRIARSSLPSLSSMSDPHLPNSAVGIWGKSTKKANVTMRAGRNVNPNSLPTLGQQPSSFDVFETQRKQVQSFKNLTNQKKASKSVVRTSSNASSSSYKPTYLSDTQSPSSIPSSSSSSVSLSSSVPKNKSGKPNVSLMNLESLPTPKPRVVIPPVHKTIIPDPKQWGRANSVQSDPTNDLESLIINPDTNSKKKGKQKQLLFHIGI